MPFTWPAELPAPLQGSFSEQPQNRWLSSSPEKGFPRRRARFSAGMMTYPCTIKLIRQTVPTVIDRKAIFWAFYNQVGAGEFTWTHPTDGDMQGRFNLDSLPVVSHEAGKIWNASFILEVLP